MYIINQNHIKGGDSCESTEIDNSISGANQ